MATNSRRNFTTTQITAHKQNYGPNCFLCSLNIGSHYTSNNGESIQIHYQADHWDDNRNNNNDCNLRLLCLNCHKVKTDSRRNNSQWEINTGFGEYPLKRED